MEKERELFERLREFTVPELCDGAGVFSAMDYHIKPWTGRMKIVGRALTVKVPAGEGAIVSRAIELAGEGDVIVIAGQGICQCSYWGDHRSLCARLQGAAGVVIDGAFRDLEGCEEAGFPIFARALTCGTAQKTGEGQINVCLLYTSTDGFAAGKMLFPGIQTAQQMFVLLQRYIVE